MGDSSRSVVIDLEGITNLSSAFSFELFGRIYSKFPKEFGKRIKVRFDLSTESETIKLIIKRAVDQYAIKDVKY